MIFVFEKNPVQKYNIVLNILTTKNMFYNSFFG